MSRQTFPIPLETIYTAVIAVALLLLATPSWAAPVINSTTVAGNQLTISGTGLSGTPLTVRLNGTTLTIVSSSATQIVANLGKLPAPGTYRLVVRAGTPSTVAYVGISAAPNIVAQVAFVNQTGIPLTTLVTPQSSGLFRISGALVGPPGCSPPMYGLHFSWTDDTGSDQGYLLLANDTPIGNVYPLSFIVRDMAGAPLSYEVFSSQVLCPYNLFFTVEQLQ
jgi:hypothetical protein